jgi:P27 family predicted phage terminase small subunit
MNRESDATHTLRGTGTSAAPETDVGSGKPRCPKELTPEGKRIFRDICRELKKRRALTSGDARIIEVLAGAVERYRRAMAQVREEGEIVSYTRLNNHGEEVVTKSKNLYLAVATEAEGKILSIVDRLGLTPLNRVRVRPTKDEDSEGIKFL